MIVRNTVPMKSWKSAKSKVLKSIKGVCLDIDDTLSTEGKLTGEAFQALWNLKKSGFFVIPVTGRPAGWCDLIARFWPVDAVVGENGAFTFFMEKGIRKRTDTLPENQIEQVRSRIQGLKVSVKQRFSKVQWASDQSYREYDLAIDFCEDVPPWKDAEVDELVSFCESQGAHAKVSSIHVNAWFGDYDKSSGLRHFLNAKRIAKLPKWDQWIFIGDSPNDEPLFRAFHQSVGVANLKRFEKKLKFPPTYLTDQKSGLGFCEFSKKLIASR